MQNEHTNVNAMCVPLSLLSFDEAMKTLKAGGTHLAISTPCLVYITCKSTEEAS
jgi:hypothetical protein